MRSMYSYRLMIQIPHIYRHTNFHLVRTFSKRILKVSDIERSTDLLKPVQKLTLSALFLALGLVLPFFTGQIPQIGNMLCPMHFPVLLCGMICGWKYGLGIGLILPIMRSLMFGMPPIFPQATAMAFELASYGALSGLLYERFANQSIGTAFASLIGAMLGGRIVWGIVMTILMHIVGQPYTFGMFFTAAFANALPGIIVQLLLIPLVLAVLDKTSVLRFKQAQETGAAA